MWTGRANEADLIARHSWLVRNAMDLQQRLEADPDYDAKVAGWWCWGAQLDRQRVVQRHRAGSTTAKLVDARNPAPGRRGPGA